MKKLKKILALALAMAMVLSMTALSAFAADTNYSITVTPSGDNVSIEGNTYNAYKLFDVTYSDTNNDNSNDAFAYSISTDNYFYKTAKAKTELDKYFTFSDTADSTVKAVTVKDGVTFDTKAAYELAELLNKANVLSAAPVAGSATGTAKNAGDKAEIKNLPSAGYYIVTGEGHALDGDNKTVTAAVALTTTQPTATIKAKVDAPSVDKEVDTPIDTDKHENQKSIGDTVNYTINSEVPDMTGYTQKYFFVVTDTLSKGLTLVDDDTSDPADSIPDGFEVKIGSETLTRVANAAAVKDNPTKTYYVEKNTTANGTTIKLVFSNFIQYKGTYNAETQAWTGGVEGQAITIKYNAVVNDDAVIGNAGNTNTVKIKYSNNPNEEGTGSPDTPDEPNSSDKTGETPDHTTKTYVTGIELEKVDKADKTKLAGVTFKMEGTNLNDVKETRYDRFVPLTDAEKADTSFTNKWYLLKDGTYTQDEPITEGDNKNVDSYADTTPGYKKITDATTNPTFQKGEGETVVYTGVTDSNGLMKFEGLSAGTYTLTELKTLDGYNLLNAPITITVTAKTKTENEKTVFDTWEVKNGETALTENATSHLFQFQVENGKGTELPSTGGIGTTIFYVVGAILVIGAGVVLITKRRMEA